MKSTRKSAGKMTKVVFRRYPDGQVIALFPDIPWSGRRGEITSYMHVGQHGAADYAGVIAMTRPAHEKEYRNPLSELRAIGYDDLHIMRRARPGTVYTIILANGRKVHDVIYHACVASGKSYFAKGDKTYPAEKVRNHSITGHAASDGSRRNGTPNPDRFAITDEVCEVVDVVTTPETNPEMFRCRVKCLMYSGLSQAEAEKVIASTPLKLELFYDVGRGSFAIDAEAVGNTPLYNPYTGKEIPDET